MSGFVITIIYFSVEENKTLLWIFKNAFKHNIRFKEIVRVLNQNARFTGMKALQELFMSKKYQNKAGAELYQAQFKLGLTKPAIIWW